MDIRAGIYTAIGIAVLGAGLSIWIGLRSIRSGRRITFFKIRQRRMASGWRLLWLGIFLIFLVFFLLLEGEPFVYRYFPPTATITYTPTITMTP
ncbi:MAG: hypothetical protein MUP03_04645, partial [Anaerolineales bacterium]|nr:hypothetical protein [Anaerolineales bacterium]